VSNITGVSARAVLEALIEGEQDPAAIAELVHPRMRPKIPVASRIRCKSACGGSGFGQ